MDTRDVVRFIAKTNLEELPPKAVARAKLTIMDTLGVMVGGVETSAATIARESIEEMAGKGEATLFGSKTRVPSMLAAFANSVAASALDYDDGNWCAVHPASQVIPGAIAVAEGVNSSGKSLIEAVVAGYEITLRTADLLRPPPKTTLTHTTGTPGAYGMAATVAKLLNLSENETANALGIAECHAPMSMLTGIAEVGPMTKEAIGPGAMIGVQAALLARRGFTGPPTVYDDGGSDKACLNTLGSTWEILNSYFKPHPACRATHTSIEGFLELTRAHALKKEDIAKVTVEVRNWVTTLNSTRPRSLEQAQYSIPFLLGAAIVYGKVGPEEVSEKRLNDQAILDFAKKVSLVHNPAFDIKFSFENAPKRYAIVLRVETTGGKVYQHERKTPKGDPEDPLTEEELREKFISNTKKALGADAAKKAMEMTQHLETLPSIKPIIDLLNQG
ncbi:MAG: MmgE/PrpD family protein [Chloroflexi bacterium]|nr:MmgE/PrpD family protein [Chloroflexota bacterium]